MEMFQRDVNVLTACVCTCVHLLAPVRTSLHLYALARTCVHMRAPVCTSFEYKFVDKLALTSKFDHER